MHLKNKFYISDEVTEKRGFAIISTLLIISAVILLSLFSLFEYFYRVQDLAMMQQGRLEAEVVARACVSRAFSRYLNGLTNLPHKFYIGPGICMFMSAVASGDNILIVVFGYSLRQEVILTATFSKAQLKLISYSY